MKTNWDGIFGQQKVRNTLDGILNSAKKPQALIFSGRDGVGKDFIASRFAFLLNQAYQTKSIFTNSVLFSEPFVKYIFTLPRGKNETSDDGPFDKLSEAEIKTVKEEVIKKTHNPYHNISIPKANDIKISSIREINRFMSFSYEEIPYRVILISGAHNMNEESQNSLLKNLEEPPPGYLFILTTNDTDKLRETIKSRCWLMNFQPLSEDEIEKILIKYFDVDENTAKEISPFSNGSVQEAMNLLDNDFSFIKEKAILILRYSMGKKFHSAIKEISYFQKDDMQSSFSLVLKIILHWLNDVVRNRYSVNPHYFADEIDTIQKFNSRYSSKALESSIRNLEKLIYVMQNNYINSNILACNIIFEIASIIQPDLVKEIH